MSAGKPIVVNVVLRTKLPGRVNLERVATFVPGVRYKPRDFPAVIVKGYEHDGEKVSLLVFSSGAVICTGGKDPDRTEGALRSFVAMLMEKGLVERGDVAVSVENIVAMYEIGTRIDVERVSQVMEDVMYEPEQFPGMICRIGSKAALIFQSGKMILAGHRSLEEVRRTVEELKRRIEEAMTLAQSQEG